MIEARELVKYYGPLLAVDRVSLAAAPGEVLGLLGPNGAGKSTLMRVLSGYLSPSAGDATVAGFDVRSQSMQARQCLGYLPESAGLYLEMRVSEYLAYRSDIKQVPRMERSRRIERVVDTCGLAAVEHRIIGQLSMGYRQRVNLAAVLLHDPTVLILDEPTVGLDPLQKREILGLIRDFGRRRTVLFSTHILSEAEAVCDRVVIIDRGQVLADGTPSALSARCRSHTLAAELLGDATRSLAALSAIPELQAEVIGQAPTVRLRVRVPGAADPAIRARVSQALTSSGAVIVELAVTSASLDEVFARITDEGAGT